MFVRFNVVPAELVLSPSHPPGTGRAEHVAGVLFIPGSARFCLIQKAFAGLTLTTLSCTAHSHRREEPRCPTSGHREGWEVQSETGIIMTLPTEVTDRSTLFFTFTVLFICYCLLFIVLLLLATLFK